VGDHKIAVRAIHTKSEALRDAIDRAYLDKYSTAGAVKYAKDLGQREIQGHHNRARAIVITQLRRPGCSILSLVARIPYDLPTNHQECHKTPVLGFDESPQYRPVRIGVRVIDKATPQALQAIKSNV
jgi:hypothetical protein